MTHEQLRRSVLGAGRPMPPFLRQHNGAVWSVATNGHVVVAIRETLTKNVEGPTIKLRNIAHVGVGGDYVELDRLRLFLRESVAPVVVPNTFDSVEVEPVRIAGVTVQRPLLKRALRHLPSGPVRIRAEVGPSPHAVRIEDHHFIVVCMGLFGISKARTFRIARRDLAQERRSSHRGVKP